MENVWDIKCDVCGKNRLFTNRKSYNRAIRSKSKCKCQKYKYNGINKKCNQCQKEYYVIPCRIGISKFCSNKCSHDHRKVNNPKPFVKPAVNPLADEFFKFYNHWMKINGFHGGNDGEYYVKGINRWLDFYNESNNYVIEWDEEYHNWGKHKEKDKKREKQIIDKLKCNFYRIKQKDFSVIKIHEQSTFEGFVIRKDFDLTIKYVLNLWLEYKKRNINIYEQERYCILRSSGHI